MRNILTIASLCIRLQVSRNCVHMYFALLAPSFDLRCYVDCVAAETLPFSPSANSCFAANLMHRPSIAIEKPARSPCSRTKCRWKQNELLSRESLAER